MHNIGDNHTNVLGTLVFKTYGYVIGLVIIEFGEGLYLFLGIPADFPRYFSMLWTPWKWIPRVLWLYL